MDDQAFDDLMGETFGDAVGEVTDSTAPAPEQLASSEAEVLTSEQPGAPPISAADPAGDGAAPEAAPAFDDQSPSASPEPQQQQSPWENPENPYFQQAQEQARRIELAQRFLAVQQQLQQQQAFQERIQRLADLTPEEQQQEVLALIAERDALAQQQVRAKEAEAEALAKDKAMQILAQRHSLTADERAQLVKFDDPRQMAWWAETASAARKAKDQEVAALRKQVEQMQLQAQAKGRLASGVDAVGSGSGERNASGAMTLEGADNMDDFFAALVDRGLPF